VAGGEVSIGRGEDNDWVLADPNRHLSKHHCTVAFRSGRWTVTDHSTNGTFLDRSAEPIGRGATAPLRDGSRLTVGEYEIEVRLEEQAAAQGGFGAANPFDEDPFAPPKPAPAPFQNDPFGRDPFAVEPPARPVATDPFGDLGGGPGPASPAIPPDFDPLSDVQGGDRLSDPSWTSAGSRPDHTPAASDAFVPPPVVQNAIPDDWDLDIQPQPAPPAPPPAPPIERGGEPFDLGPAPRPAASDAFAPPITGSEARVGPRTGTRIDAAPPRTTPEPEDGYLAGGGPPPPHVAPAQPARPAARPEPGPEPAGDGEALLAAFLAGAGLPDLVRRSNIPPEQLMRGLGAAFRAFVEGLREVLITRAAIKSEFRIEQTIIAARGNNPLKFSPSVEDALAAMLGESRGAFMNAETAVRDSLEDIKRHEMATMEAMQAGLRAVLAQLDPAKLREEAEAAGGLSLVPAQRRARAFDLFEARFAAILRDAENTTDGAFARAFARAYEAASGRG
jgi:type VI secretion system protein ImpI/type VI secretion system protein